MGRQSPVISGRRVRYTGALLTFTRRGPAAKPSEGGWAALGEDLGEAADEALDEVAVRILRPARSSRHGAVEAFPAWAGELATGSERGDVERGVAPLDKLGAACPWSKSHAQARATRLGETSPF